MAESPKDPTDKPRLPEASIARGASEPPYPQLSRDETGRFLAHASHSLRGALASATTALQIILCAEPAHASSDPPRHIPLALDKLAEVEEGIDACVFVAETLTGLADRAPIRKPLGPLLREIPDRFRCWGREGSSPRVSLDGLDGLDGAALGVLVEEKPFLCLARAMLAVASAFAPPAAGMRLHVAGEGSFIRLRLEGDALEIPTAVVEYLCSPPAPDLANLPDSTLSFQFFVIALCQSRLGAVLSAGSSNSADGSFAAFSIPVPPARTR